MESATLVELPRASGQLSLDVGGDPAGKRKRPRRMKSSLRMQRLGNVTLPQRIAEKIQIGEACWFWTAAQTDNGYGQAWWEDRNWGAHRLIYQLAVGPIPAGFQVDHLCESKACVNPAHLEVVTPRENTFRCERAPATRNVQKTHCPRGHAYDEANTIYRPDGSRKCRECKRRRAGTA